MQRVLLTGASGFIGYHLVRRLLEENCVLRCLVRSSSATEQLRPFGVEFCHGDISEPDTLGRAVAGCDTIFHLAGRVRAKNLPQFLETNRDGTRNLARAAAAQPNPPTFVHVSTLAVMGPSKNGVPKRETDHPQPISHYGISKLEGERILQSFAAEMPCSVIRPGVVFGEWDRMNFELFKAVRNFGFMPNPGWTSRYYSWIHAADLAELAVLTARRGNRLFCGSGDVEPSDRGIYFASVGNGFNLDEIGREIGRSLGRKRTMTIKTPPVGVWVVASYFELLKRTTGKPQPYDWAKAHESFHNWCGSPEKAEAELSFTPLTTITERFDQTTRWYRENGWL